MPLTNHPAHPNPPTGSANRYATPGRRGSRTCAPSSAPDSSARSRDTCTRYRPPTPRSCCPYHAACMDDKGFEPPTSTRDAGRSLALLLVPFFGRGLRGLPPRTVLGVPFDRLREARLEVSMLRSPTQLGAQLGRIDRVPTVMARTILRPIERILRLLDWQRCVGQVLRGRVPVR